MLKTICKHLPFLKKTSTGKIEVDGRKVTIHPGECIIIDSEDHEIFNVKNDVGHVYHFILNSLVEKGFYKPDFESIDLSYKLKKKITDDGYVNFTIEENDGK